MDDRLDEILHRLRDLDDRLARLEREHGRGDRDRGGRDRGPRDHGCRDHGCRDHGDRDHRGYGDYGRDRDRRDDGRDRGFDERRVIDTIVRLTCENLEPVIADVVARELDKRKPQGDGE